MPGLIRLRSSKPPNAGQPLERDIQAACLGWLALQGALVIRTNSGLLVAEHKGKRRAVRFNNQPGCSDAVCCYRGRFVGLEIKRPGGRLTLLQKAFLDAVRLAGGLAFVVRSLEELQAAIAAEFGEAT